GGHSSLTRSEQVALHHHRLVVGCGTFAEWNGDVGFSRSNLDVAFRERVAHERHNELRLANRHSIEPEAAFGVRGRRLRRRSYLHKDARQRLARARLLADT